MAFSQEDIRKNREYFAEKLRAERQLTDVQAWVKNERGAPESCSSATVREPSQSGPAHDAELSKTSAPKERMGSGGWNRTTNLLIKSSSKLYQMTELTALILADLGEFRQKRDIPGRV